jgi:hypothetical protein
MIYLTTHASYIDAALIERLRARGVTRFIAYEVPVDEARKRYGEHFDIVAGELMESNDLRVLDYDGSRAFGMFSLRELGAPYVYEG